MTKPIAIILAVLVLVSVANAGTKIKPVPFTLSVAVVGLGLADTMLTWHGTQHHGLYEQNKLFAPFFERGRTVDYFAVLNISLLASAAIIFACNALISQDSKTCKILGYSILVAAVVFRGSVVLHNIRLNHRTR